MRTILLLLLMMLAVHADAQCKKGKIPQRPLRYSKSATVIKPDYLTKHREIIGKVDMAVFYNFAKAEEATYMFIYIFRAASKKISIQKNNKFMLVASNGEKLSLYPCDDYSGGRVIRTYQVGAFYNLTKEDLDFFRTHDIVEIKFDIYSEKKITGIFRMEDGEWKSNGNNIYTFSTPIRNNKKRKRLQESANCIYAKL